MSITFYGQEEWIDEVKVHDENELLELENFIANQAGKRSENLESCKKIRIVVHVVYDGTPGAIYSGNITQEQVISQIRFTNQFLRNDSLAFDSLNIPLGYELEFAKTDPNGNATNGIVYTDGTALFGANWATYGLKNNNSYAISATLLANQLGWSADASGKKYLNCYVVPKIDGNTGSGVQAYAYFPTSNSIYGNYNLSNTFGANQFAAEYGQNFKLKSYTNKGYTFTHELGHNFALFHTFQSTTNCDAETNCGWQGDRVCDTAPQTQGFGCVGSCGFLSYNVMDYISQDCKKAWTQGQIDRAISVIEFSLQDYLVCADCESNPDLNGDGFVSILDISLAGSAFGSVRGDARYNESFDLNCDGLINMLDISLISASYGNVPSVAIEGLERSENRYYDITGREILKPQKTGIYIEVDKFGNAKKITVFDGR